MDISEPRIYRIWRDQDGGEPGGVYCDVERLFEDGRPRGSYALVHLVHYAPAGFEYGRMCPGALDLALSILRDYLGEQVVRITPETKAGCVDFHRAFAEQVIAHLPAQTPMALSLRSQTVGLWLANEAKKRHAA